MVDYYEKYKWSPVVEVKEEDIFLFTKIFYIHNLPGKIMGNVVYSPSPYREAIEAIVDAHYEGKLSREYYRKIDTKKVLVEPENTSHFRKHFLKIIGPVLLLLVLLIFIRFLFVLNIL